MINDKNKVTRMRDALRIEMEHLEGRDAFGDHAVVGVLRSFLRLARDESLIRFYDTLTSKHDTGGRT